MSWKRINVLSSKQLDPAKMQVIDLALVRLVTGLLNLFSVKKEFENSRTIVDMKAKVLCSYPAHLSFVKVFQLTKH